MSLSQLNEFYIYGFRNLLDTIDIQERMYGGKPIPYIYIEQDIEINDDYIEQLELELEENIKTFIKPEIYLQEIKSLYKDCLELISRFKRVNYSLNDICFDLIKITSSLDKIEDSNWTNGRLIIGKRKHDYEEDENEEYFTTRAMHFFYHKHSVKPLLHQMQSYQLLYLANVLDRDLSLNLKLSHMLLLALDGVQSFIWKYEALLKQGNSLSNISTPTKSPLGLEPNLSAKMHLLCSTGVIDYLCNTYSPIGVSQTNIGKLISYLLQGDDSKSRTIQSYINSHINSNQQLKLSKTKPNSNFKTKKTEVFVNKVFNECKIPKQ